MAPDADIKQINSKLSSDFLAHLFVWAFLISVGIYYDVTKGFHGSDALKLLLILGVVGLQSVTRFLPKTRDWECFNSGGTGALMLYNIAVVLIFLWFIPLYSPFMLVIPAVMFITIYYRGTGGFLLAIAFLVLTVVTGTLREGTPAVPFGQSFPYLMLVLGAAYGEIIQRVGYIDNQVRAEFHRASNKVELEREQLTSLINSMADAVIATDHNGKILFYNGAAANLLNTNKSLVDEAFSDHVSLLDKTQNKIDLLGLARRQNRNFQTEDYNFISNDHEQIDLFIDVAPIHANYGSQVEQKGFIIVMRDITKKKSLDEERDEFISVTSHELRTPIAVAEANLSMALKMSEQKVDPDSAQRLQVAYHNVVFLADLVNDLSTLSRAENQGLHFEAELIDPKQLVNKVAEDYKQDTEMKKLTLNVTVPDVLPAVYSSPLYVREILENFVSNAIKYTNEGSITIAVQPGEKDDLVFSVKDTGIGIGTSDKAKVFDKYYRSEDFRTRETRGTGLGLYITYKLAEYLRGKIWLESELDKGSTFYMQVPSLEPGLQVTHDAKVPAIAPTAASDS